VTAGLRRHITSLCVMVASAALVTPAPAAGQDAGSIRDALSFLLTNRSIPTGDFVQDDRAAAATRDTIAELLLVELGTLPLSGSASGFTYRLNPGLGTNVRTSASFGPFFTERSLTSGKDQSSFGISYRHMTFRDIDGRPLDDGTLVATASRFRGTVEPFDVETVRLRIETDTVTASVNYGVTDRLDLSAAVPFVTLKLSGTRTDTYHGSSFLQATAVASNSGLGDVVVRAHYDAVRKGGSGLAVAVESRLPTGSDDNLLGAGRASINPRLIGSVERDRLALHADIGYLIGGFSDELTYGGAATIVGGARLTVVGEIIGRRLRSTGRLTDRVEAHPSVPGVETVRLTSVPETAQRAVVVLGLKWNVASTWLLGANVLRPVTSAGLNPRWVATLGVDYSYGQ
jgi:hypothetical protein